MKFAPIALCLLPFLVFSQKEIPADLRSGIDSDFPYLHDLYLHCHANPGAFLSRIQHLRPHGRRAPEGGI
ncbi:MAG: hypothetical protein IPJ00_00035 [Saprospirales bacterium]|nr:hypothetical protein [Saprospirales bacterium]